MGGVNTPPEPAGFHPAQRLLDLANLLDAEPDASADDLAAVLAAHGETAADLDDFDERDAAAIRPVVSRLAAVLREADTDRAASAINELLATYASRPRLSNHDGHTWHLHVDSHDDAPWAEWLAASSALALAQLLSERGRAAWGQCAAPGCSTLFLDTGPGSPRKYCSPTCATRDRVARHRAKRKSSRADPAEPAVECLTNQRLLTTTRRGKP